MWPFKRNRQIKQVVVFCAAVPGGLHDAMLAHGKGVHPTYSTLATEADAGMRLGGALEEFVIRNAPPAEAVPYKPDDEWLSFLEARFAGQQWKHWGVETRDSQWMVVAIFG